MSYVFRSASLKSVRVYLFQGGGKRRTWIHHVNGSIWSYPAFTCSNLTKETLELGVKYVLVWKIVLVTLLLTLNIISHLIVVFLLLILNMYLQAGALIWPTSEDKRLNQRLSKLVGFFIISSVLPKTKTISFFKKRGISSKLPRISNIWCNITRIWKPWFVILRILIKTPRFQSK